MVNRGHRGYTSTGLRRRLHTAFCSQIRQAPGVRSFRWTTDSSLQHTAAVRQLSTQHCHLPRASTFETYTRWVKPWPNCIPYLEVTNHPWKGHVFTIPERSPAELPGRFCLFLERNWGWGKKDPCISCSGQDDFALRIFENSSIYLAILLVTFLGMWKSDPFKGCCWPPIRWESLVTFESPGRWFWGDFFCVPIQLKAKWTWTV